MFLELRIQIIFFVGNRFRLHIQISASEVIWENVSLPNVLVVPEMKKNLVSVVELPDDNDVTVEFDSTNCRVKDKTRCW